MAEQSVGQISLDLVLNSKQFKNQLQNSVNSAVSSASKSCAGSVSSLFSKLGAIGAAAFSAKMLIDFGKSALELGSDLAEVQNVVDVAFEDMAGEADEFAKNALKNFGLSETSAKRYMGTFGAMASSFGYNTREAEKMAETLTGLTGDVASFYNLDSSVAYTKLKSVFTGETESLKELGVVMTQTALDQFALENGYGKTTKAMTEQEKVALRLAFVTSNLDKASGDFIRTQDSWANQTRILAESWNAFKAQIGQALIQVLTPMIKFINIIMAKLIQLASLLNKFTGKLFGKQDVKAASGVSTAIGGISDAAGTAADNTEKIGGAAKKAAKEIKKSLAGFDEITTLQDNSDSSSGGGAGVGGAGGGLDMPDMSSVEEMPNLIDTISEKTNGLFDNIKNGFNDVFDTSRFDKVKENIDRIGKATQEIFGSEKVQKSIENFRTKTEYAFGQVIGSTASIGTSIASGITGSFANHLEEDKGYIQNRLSETLDIAGHLNSQVGETSKAWATIISVMDTDAFQKVGGDIIGLVDNSLATFSETCIKVGDDFYTSLTQPIIDNAPIIKTQIEDMCNNSEPSLNRLKEAFKELGEVIQQTYDTFIHPFFEDFEKDASESLPFVTGLLTKIGTFALTHIATTLSGFAEILSGGLKIAKGIATGDMDELLEGIKTFGKGVWDFLTAGLQSLYACLSEDTKKWIKGKIEEIKKFFNDLIKNISEFFGNITKTVKDKFDEISQKFEDAKSNLSKKAKEIGEGIRNSLTEPIEKMKEKLVQIFEDLWKGIKKVINGMLSGVESMVKGLVNGINKAIEAINGIKIKIPRWVPMYGGDEFSPNISTISSYVSIPKLAEGGYVAANTPQLAMIGDNRYEGEIVAPESKITEAVTKGMTPIIDGLKEVAGALIGNQNSQNIQVTCPVYLDGKMLETFVVNSTDLHNIRSGGYR